MADAAGCIDDAGEIRILADLKLAAALKQTTPNKGAAIRGTKKTGPRGTLLEPRDDSPTLAGHRTPARVGDTLDLDVLGIIAQGWGGGEKWQSEDYS